MKFINAEKCGQYTVYMCGIDGQEVQAQIFRENEIKAEKVCSTRKHCEKWVRQHLEDITHGSTH